MEEIIQILQILIFIMLIYIMIRIPMLISKWDKTNKQKDDDDDYLYFN